MAIIPFEKVREIADSLERDVWMTAHKEWEIDDEYFELGFKVRAPRRVAKVVPPTGRAKVTGAVDQLITSDPAVSRRAIGRGDNAQTDADRIAAWGTLVLKRLDLEMACPPFKEFATNLFLYGYAVMYGPIWNDEAWPFHPDRQGRRRNSKPYRDEMAEWEKKDAGVFPYWGASPHPSKILIDPNSGKVPPFGIMREKRFTINIQREFGEEKVKGAPYELREVTTYFSEDQLLVAVDDDVVQDVDNPFGFVPFTQAFSGFGRDPGVQSM